MKRICLFEDAAVAQLEPLALTRPAFELRCGCTSLEEKLLRPYMDAELGLLVRPYLAAAAGERRPHAHVNDPVWLAADTTLMLNGRWLADDQDRLDCTDPHVGEVDGQVAYAVVPRQLLSDCRHENIDDHLAHWRQTLPRRPASGTMIDYPWLLVDANPSAIESDFAHLFTGRSVGVPETVALLGDGARLAIDATVELEPFVTVDVRNGPVVIDEGVRITSFSRIEGPCYIGRNSQIMGAKIRGGTSIGPECRIGGEVEAAIVHGYSNKYHDGFLGHAYVGEWVNLGAGTSNSDLRNDYGEVTVPMGQSRIATGRKKVGCFIGDHTKTALGTLINTGSNIGAFAGLIPSGGLAPKYVPSFTILWRGSLQPLEDFDSLMTTAERMMARRGCTLSDTLIALYHHVFTETSMVRRWLLRRAYGRKVS